MSDFAKATVLGYVGTEPDIRRTASGKSVVRFRIAATRRYNTQDGSQAQQTTWLTCVAWGQTADAIAKYVTKGRRLLLEGHIQERDYTDKNNQSRKAYEIVISEWHLLDSPPKTKADASESSESVSFDNDLSASDIGEDELPF